VRIPNHVGNVRHYACDLGFWADVFRIIPVGSDGIASREEIASLVPLVSKEIARFFPQNF
jgi:hypothetical protein